MSSAQDNYKNTSSLAGDSGQNFSSSRQQLDAARLRLYASQAQSVAFFGPLLACSVASLFWPTPERVPAILWAAITSLLFIVRLVYVRLWVPDYQLFVDTRFWKTKLAAYSVLISFVWSASSWLLLTEDTEHLTPYVLLSLAVTATGLIALMAFLRIVFILSESALLLPAAFMLCGMDDSSMVSIGISLVIFWAGTLLLGLRVGAAAIAGLRTEIENKVLVEQLRQQKHLLEQANTAKSRFLAAASHDLRQPLYAMSLLSDSVLNQAAGVEADTKAAFSQSLQGLKNISDGLTEISQLEAGAVQPTFENVDIAQLVEALLLQFTPIAEAKGLSLQTDMAASRAISDPKLLRRLISNLLTNAIDYTKQGFVKVSVRQQQRQIFVEVADSGIGIAKPDLEKVFDEFQRLPSAQGADSVGSGLGLGLSISQRLASLLGAKLTVTSTLGQGSCFCISLPASQQASVP